MKDHKYIKDGWYREPFFGDTISTGFKVEKILHSEVSKYQQIDVFETKSVGKLLLLDGKTMVSDRDEFVYHECISHIPYMTKPNVKKVLIVGGGDGGVVREFARHSEIQQIDLVEIDERVIDVSRKFFPQCTIALDDPRVTVHAKDGIQFVKDHKNTYDLIVIDSTDPEDFAEGLFKEEFYRQVSEALVDDGIMTAQTENPFFDEYGITDIYNNLRKVFPNVQSYWGPIAIYPGTYWTFAYASKKYRGQDIVNSKMTKMKEIQDKLQWYSTDWHQGAFHLSQIHKRVTGV